jgi:hypothetical protein
MGQDVDGGEGMSYRTTKVMWTDLRGNFSPQPTLTCQHEWPVDKPWPPPLASNPKDEKEFPVHLL